VPIDPRAIEQLLRFLKAIDEQLTEDSKLEMFLAGGAAILLAYDGEIATDDVDLIAVRKDLPTWLVELAGKGSALHRETDYYLDIVAPGLFPQEWGWRKRALTVDTLGLKHIELRILELHDLILSKLKRFAGKDRDDIRGLCEREEFSIDTLRSRFRNARQMFDFDQREKLDRNFQFVETEFLALEPTRFD
jgi:hypothetical protein